eukprot:3705327-Amphidinium_carterae.1
MFQQHPSLATLSSVKLVDRLGWVPQLGVRVVCEVAATRPDFVGLDTGLSTQSYTVTSRNPLAMWMK